MKAVDKLATVVQNADNVPDEVLGAVNDVLAQTRVPWHKALAYKNGEFSKTALFATLANVLVLTAYVLSWFAGSELGPWTIPAFDTGAAAAILAIVNGTYVANHNLGGGQ